MSPTLALILLFTALLLPLIAAVLVRLLPNITPARAAVIAGVCFGIAMVCVLALGRAELTALRIGELTILQPAQPATPVLPLPTP